jgi:hypothetical protein
MTEPAAPYDPSLTGELPFGELCMGDIAGCLDMINLCSRRGAFEASEFEVIAILRNRLIAYLETNNFTGQEEGSDNEQT